MNRRAVNYGRMGPVSGIIPGKSCHSPYRKRGLCGVAVPGSGGQKRGEIDRRRCHLRTSRQLLAIPMAHCHCRVGSLDIAGWPNSRPLVCPLDIHTASPLFLAGTRIYPPRSPAISAAQGRAPYTRSPRPQF